MNKLKEIAEHLKRAGGTAYVVGGYVRDMLLNLPSKDLDVEVYGLYPNELEAVLSRFGTVRLVGESFGVYKLGDYDFTLPRRERKMGRKHTSYDVTVDPLMSLEEATRRRDLTINALMLNPLSGEIIDLHDGLHHLEQGVIKHISDNTFAEDALRVMRVAQFSARFGFQVHKSTKALCEWLLPEMKYLSRERFFIEFEKILMKAQKPSIAFQFLLEIGALEMLFPELHILTKVEQGKLHHPEGDVFTHTMLALDSLPVEDRRLDIMFAILTHDMGKATVEANQVDDDIIHFYGHERDDVPVKSFLRRLTNNTDLTDSVLKLVRYHMKPYAMVKEVNKATVRRLALKVDIKDLMIVHHADISGRHGKRDTSHIDRIRAIAQDIESEIKPIIMGRDLIALGYKPAKWFSMVLGIVFEKQLDGEFLTHEEGLKIADAIAKEYEGR